MQQVRALIAGGSDLLLVETIFDSLNAKAALVAIQEVFEQDGRELPVMISAAVGRGGETMISAQTVEAFWNAVQHVKPFSVGLNCSLGPDLMYPFLAELSEKSSAAISCYPNAGLPNPSRRPGSIWNRRTWRAISATSRARADQYRRRLLRQHAGAHCGDRQGARRPARRGAGTRPASACGAVSVSVPARRTAAPSVCPDRSRSPSKPASTS
jgi:S-methylmethionine-dependent homocysteine/selenocysteine methylase